MAHWIGHVSLAHNFNALDLSRRQLKATTRSLTNKATRQSFPFNGDIIQLDHHLQVKLLRPVSDKVIAQPIVKIGQLTIVSLIGLF
jgi:hypothetical protein